MTEWQQGFVVGGVLAPITIYLGQIVFSDWIFLWRLEKMIKKMKHANGESDD